MAFRSPSAIRALNNVLIKQSRTSASLLANSGTTPTAVIAMTTATTATANSNNNQQYRYLSTQKSKQRFTNPRLRTHAISIFDGDYSDFTDEDVIEEPAFPDDDSDDGWEITASSSSGGKNDDMDEDVLLRRREEEEALKNQKEIDAQKQKWIENARPPVRQQIIDERGRSYGRGGRKTSTARVWVQPGVGTITVNKREFVEYFPRESDRELILSPFIATKTCGKFDVYVRVESGGLTGKAGAIRHGIARALEKYNPEYRPPMKRLGFMTRDARMVEPKKIGLKKARKAPQWVRR